MSGTHYWTTIIQVIDRVGGFPICTKYTIMDDVLEISSLIPVQEFEQQRSIPMQTETLKQQLQVEKKCILKLLKSDIKLNLQHLEFLLDPIENGLAGYFVVLDASKPWIIYWILNSMSILGHEITNDIKLKAFNTLKSCLNEDGGFGGGMGQITHLATSYAAVNAIAIINTKECYELLDKQKLLILFKSLKLSNGSFRVHDGGEIDIRASYCVLSICKLLDIDTTDLKPNCANFIKDCQGWDGGIGPFPGVEAHGGYTYCGLAALVLLNETEIIDLDRLLFWLTNRQMKVEGGFCGRTNKLVDGCYSYWIGASLSLVQAVLNKGYLYSPEKLQQYILKCCQAKNGGLRDKPGK